MGGQTALNCALSLRKQGTLAKFNVEMIGASADAIDKAEDRQLFRNAMEKIGLQTPKSRLANASALKKADRDKYLADRERLEGHALAEFERQWTLGENERHKRYQEQALGEALMALSEIGLPAIIRPSFSAGPEAASPTTRKNSSTSSSGGSMPRRPTRC
jgi:carbamoyl-phosphate synthase large subunit